MFQNLQHPSQMQPGDKLSMTFSKSPKPPLPDYLQDGAQAPGQMASPAAVQPRPQVAGSPEVPMTSAMGDPGLERQLLMRMMAARAGQ